MIKNFTIALLSFVTVLAISYGIYQNKRAHDSELKANENARLAREMMIKAEEQQKLAEQQRRIAEMNMVEAMKQRDIAEQEIQKSKKTK